MIEIKTAIQKLLPLLASVLLFPFSTSLVDKRGKDCAKAHNKASYGK